MAVRSGPPHLYYLFSVHREAIHFVIAQIFMNLAFIGFAYQGISILLGRELVIKCTWTAYAAALTRHTFDKVIRQLGSSEKKQCLFTFCRAICLINFCVNIFIRLFQAFQYSSSHSAGVGKAFAEYGSNLVVIRTWL